ncbi:uncharacterized protein FOMMEDRAFT_158546 [Fomitiporia mediterranea MF3/22]|uniref:uncharacterized protein n=1 Tax=Fomitiporia mediterranea (strain MF3/22) TaxID=694068 RepID=UPI000440935F|nr:uncharacterized protein FOMMEDRAFT_158546 [Fomitiporia mediterranea MF3/22]EJD01404.1 hypothetical protein FOMMEDRAFT_158546 [Fomitiporia mediterranea MF3/22]
MTPFPVAISFRRFLHSTTCLRAAASSTLLSPRAALTPVSAEPADTDDVDAQPQSPPSGPKVTLGVLSKFMDDMVAVPHNYEQQTQQKPSRPQALFKDQVLIRPIDFHRRAHKYRAPPWRRPNVGPGREARYNDIFIQLGIDPRREADNVTLMSNYMTALGRIKPRKDTGLSQRSQRLLGKAIKRAKMMGVLPILSNPRMRDRSQPLPPKPEKKDSRSRSYLPGR